MNNLLVILMFFCFISTKAQQFEIVEELPEPVPDWEWLLAKIVYPEYAILGGIDTKYNAQVIIDSTGKIKDVKVINITKYMGHDWMFLPTIKNAIEKVEWKPGIVSGKKKEMEFSFNLYFSRSGNTKVNYEVDSKVKRTIYVESTTTIKIDSIKNNQ
jgi:hypothetical protein